MQSPQSLLPVLVLLCVVLFSPLKAQIPALSSTEQKHLPLNSFDIVFFEADAKQYRTEFLVSYPKWKVPYRRRDTNRFTTELLYRISLVSETGSEWNESLSLRSEDDSARILSDHLLGFLKITLSPGNYRVDASLENAETGFVAKTRRTFSLPKLDTTTLRMSSLMPSLLIMPNQSPNSPFLRNGLDVVPHPENSFGSGYDTAYFYAELYGMKRASLLGTRLLQKIYLTRSGKPIEGSHQSKYRLRQYDAVVFSEKVFVGDIISGGYDFHVELYDSLMTPVLKTKRKLFVSNPLTAREAKSSSTSSSFLETEYARLTSDEVEEMRGQITPIITDDEKKAYEGLETLESKKFFLQKFWEVRGGLSALREYISLVAETKWWGTSFRKGYATDRGRILLRYGKATNVELFPQEANTRAHEIWTYENLPSRGRAIFVFGDIRGTGELELIHSDVPNEAFNPNWQLRLRTTQTGTNNFMR